MKTIQDVVNELLETKTLVQVGDMLGVSYSMVSQYKKSYNPSLEVAKTWYKKTKEVLHPYSEESLIKEINNEK